MIIQFLSKLFSYLFLFISIACCSVFFHQRGSPASLYKIKFLVLGLLGNFPKSSCSLTVKLLICIELLNFSSHVSLIVFLSHYNNFARAISSNKSKILASNWFNLNPVRFLNTRNIFGFFLKKKRHFLLLYLRVQRLVTLNHPYP